jgi:rubrerythrin
MKQWNSTDEILDFAIQNEEEAAKFYTDLAAKMERPNMRDVFEGFALEEKGHKAKLLRIKETGELEPSSKQVMDLKIGDYLVAVDPGHDLTYPKALILAMKKEKAAFKLYTDMAAAAQDAGLKDTLLALAQEEAKHKLRFEIEYDDNVMTDN